MAAASGWMARAERLLEGVDECAAHGWLTLDHAPFTRDPSERERLALAALAIGRRYGDADLEFDALALLGQVYVVSGRRAEGMKLIDEAMAAISGGEVVGVGTIGDIYCRLLSACEHVADVRRAEEWLAAADRLVAWSDFVAPTCRCHYGGILIAIGRWSEAEEELLAALRAFEAGYRAERIGPLVRLAALRVRQGRFEEAERLLEGGEWHPAARRSLATIALARGDLALAEDLARLCFEGGEPVRPGLRAAARAAGGHPARPRRSAGREGDARPARRARRRLRGRAGAAPPPSSPRVGCSPRRGTSGPRRGSGPPSSASRPSTCRSRPRGRGSRSPGRSHRARGPRRSSEARLALGTFERLGAARDADAAAGLLRELGSFGRASPRGHGALTRRETEVLSLLAAGLSNAEIGERLVISRRTAEHHVASILSKLDLRTRAEAAAYAARARSQDP